MPKVSKAKRSSAMKKFHAKVRKIQRANPGMKYATAKKRAAKK